MSSISAAVSSAALQAHWASQLRLHKCSANPSPEGSLAQRLGLVPGPPPPLTPGQWLEVHLQSQARRDSRGDCAICLRPFRAEGQVLLSCSHTFHAACLAALERFSRRQRCCPLCRCAAYEKRRIDDAERLWRHACAARIQAAWRGVLARRHFRALRRLLPPQHPGLRRRWCAEVLQEGTAALVQAVEEDGGELEALFAELDATRQACGAVFRALVAASPRPRGGEGAALDALPAPDEAAAGPAQAAPDADSQGAGQAQGGDAQQGAAGGKPAVDWEAVLDACLRRDSQPECPICLCALAPSAAVISSKAGDRQRSCSSSTGSGSGSGPTSGWGLAVLSCSHAFHAGCLSSFEAFSVASDLAPACPCCRSAYQRLDLR